MNSPLGCETTAREFPARVRAGCDPWWTLGMRNVGEAWYAHPWNGGTALAARAVPGPVGAWVFKEPCSTNRGLSPEGGWTLEGGAMWRSAGLLHQ